MPLEHAILAMLDYQPMSGYDLKKFFDMSVAHFWSATQSHIYKALSGLEQKSWVEKRAIPQEGRPNRNEYSITEAGRLQLRGWLTAPLPLDQVRHSWLIQIFFSHFSTNEEIAALIETRIHEMRARLEIYKTVAQAAIDQNAAEFGIERLRLLWQTTLDYGIAYYQFELDWHAKMLDRIRNLPPMLPPENQT